MSSDLILQISQVAQQLRSEGKAVNLALVRARLPSTDPAKLFSAFQHWRNNPQLDVSAAAPQPAAATSAQANEPALQAQLQRIEDKLDQLLALLDKQAR